jgi:hypothetical protein
VRSPKPDAATARHSRVPSWRSFCFHMTSQPLGDTSGDIVTVTVTAACEEAIQ